MLVRAHTQEIHSKNDEGRRFKVRRALTEKPPRKDGSECEKENTEIVPQ
jgi:hypothetical protein